MWSRPFQPLGRALLDFQKEPTKIDRFPLVVNLLERGVTFGTSPMPMADVLRLDGLTTLDRSHIERARGRVLDVGAGGGPLALALLARGFRVTALDPEPEVAAFLVARGLGDTRCDDLDGMAAGDETWDTLLLAMNGLGFAGARRNLPALLSKLCQVMAPGGCIVADSANLLSNDDPEEKERAHRRLAAGREPGEIEMALTYRGHTGPSFPWFYAGQDDIAWAAALCGLEGETLACETDGTFSVALTRK